MKLEKKLIKKIIKGFPTAFSSFCLKGAGFLFPAPDQILPTHQGPPQASSLGVWASSPGLSAMAGFTGLCGAWRSLGDGELPGTRACANQLLPPDRRMISKGLPDRNDYWIALMPNQSRKHRFQINEESSAGKNLLSSDRHYPPVCFASRPWTGHSPKSQPSVHCVNPLSESTFDFDLQRPLIIERHCFTAPDLISSLNLPVLAANTWKLYLN